MRLQMGHLLLSITCSLVVIILCCLLLYWAGLAVYQGRASSDFIVERWPWLVAVLSLHGATWVLNAARKKA